MEEINNCPKCQSTDIYRDSVHNGLGIMYGPYGCPDCGWSEWTEYDKTDPDYKAVEDGFYKDQWGGGTPVRGIIENAERFGLGDAAREAFKE